jgi:hypothetical protein
MQVMRPVHAAARAAEQRVIDRESRRLIGLDEHRDEEIQQSQPELVRIPPAASEEVVPAAVMPHPNQTSALQHSRDRPITDAAHSPDHEQAERLEARLGEAWRKQGQQTLKRSGNLKHGRRPLRSAGRGQRANAPRPMDLSPTGFGVAALSPCLEPQTGAAQGAAHTPKITKLELEAHRRKRPTRLRSPNEGPCPG